MHKSCFILPLLLIILNTHIFAQENVPPISTDRPTQTVSPYSVSVRSFQVETGIVLTKDLPDGPDGLSAVNTYNIGSTLLRYGLVKDIELRLSGSYLREDAQVAKSTTSEAGISDILIGVKYFFAEADGLIPDAGIIADMSIPVGHPYFTSNRLMPGITLAAVHPLASILSLSYNLGFRYQESERNIYIYSLVTAVQPLKKIGIFIEAFGVAMKNKRPLNQIDLGMTYLVTNNFQLDTSYGFGLNDSAPDSFFNFGLSWRLPR